MPQYVEGDAAVHNTAPAAAAGAQAGGSPPAPVVTAGDTDLRGSMTFGTGSTATAGAMVAVTFANAFGVAPKAVQITPANAATAALQLYVTSIGTTGFTVGCNSAPASSQANTVYAFDYLVLT